MMMQMVWKFRRWMNERAAIRSLEAMDDDLLRDIGITRNTIDEAVRSAGRSAD